MPQFLRTAVTWISAKNEKYATSPRALPLHDPHRTAGRQPHRFIRRTALGKNLDQQQFAARDGHFCSLARQHFIADAVLIIAVDGVILQRIFGVCDRHALRLSAEIEQRKIGTAGVRHLCSPKRSSLTLQPIGKWAFFIKFFVKFEYFLCCNCCIFILNVI